MPDPVHGLLAHEASLRLAGFIGLGLLLALLQAWRPTRGDSRPAFRQLNNLGLVLIGTGLLRLAFPVLAVGLALSIEGRGLGLMPALGLPFALEIALSVLLLDLAIYWQHRLMHVVPLLWRLHRVHHSDTGFDLSTGVRFHPLEIAVSMGVKLGLVLALGADPLAVLLFELLLSLGSLFTHTDIALPATLDRRLRWLLVTPSMHRIHHSTWQPETDSNYGFHLSLWDRVFGSYRAQPRQPEAQMPIGLEHFRSSEEQTLPALLLQPFRRTAHTETRTDA
ncbi:sterol desaturase family protein [Aquimonas sp.]|jgi:sterol desaturase/sphingolipid hydroxylase (fatty acid hydroxylase superfamily)|uniref:sterol desaturase family protein n=1 Tax=Aquimonas sp. TaxID=1872588 RepID=UPI0037BF87CB